MNARFTPAISVLLACVLTSAGAQSPTRQPHQEPRLPAPTPGVTLPSIAVDGQPLAANVARVVEALDYLGVPLAAQTRVAIAAAGQARDARLLQELLDPLVLFSV